jgi:hypothetical protein
MRDGAKAKSGKVRLDDLGREWNNPSARRTGGKKRFFKIRTLSAEGDMIREHEMSRAALEAPNRIGRDTLMRTVADKNAWFTTNVPLGVLSLLRPNVEKTLDTERLTFRNIGFAAMKGGVGNYRVAPCIEGCVHDMYSGTRVPT